MRSEAYHVQLGARWTHALWAACHTADVPQLLRDNAGDLRVTDDVERLAAAYDDAAVTAAREAMQTARANDIALLQAVFARDAAPAAPWWRRVGSEVVRHKRYAAVVVAFLAVIVLMDPRPLPVAQDDGGETALLPSFDDQRAGAVVVATTPPLADSSMDFDLPTAEVTESFGFTPTPIEPVADTPTPVSIAPAALRIAQSGYASALAPTGAQQPPANGLPAEAIAGQVTKYSYIRLSGDASVLLLRTLSDDGTSMNAGAARMQLCRVITPNWKPQRGATTSEAPKYSNECLEGTRASGGIWRFAFSSLFTPNAAEGWAIVPVTSDNATFRLTFATTAA